MTADPVTVTLSIGSNVDAEHHTRAALDALQRRFGELTLSRVYESEAVGFDGNNFLNMVVALQTDMPLAELSQWLKSLEDEQGRRRGQARFSSRTLDVDILTYGDLHGEHEGMKLPRPEVLKNAFVLWPLSEVMPDARHPEDGRRYRQLWQNYDRSRQRLWPIDFQWNGRSL
ncbi:MAG: 2-amino-4-hydroxy-6-hydroxymethyldihydropteridine diphosphokinase [Pseudohongiellaceae bacterium]